MKRIVTQAFFVLSLCLLFGKEANYAEESSQPNLASLQWHLLQSNVTKTDLGGDLPEVVVMTLSNQQFQAINGNTNAALKYLIDQKSFKKKLLNVVFCGATASADGMGQWILIIPHTFQSTAYIVAWQIPQGGK